MSQTSLFKTAVPMTSMQG